MICLPCQKAVRKRGKHRKHDCQHSGVTGNLGWFCDCICKRLALAAHFRRHGPPSMLALDFEG